MLFPRPGRITLGLEDDAHRFFLRLSHEDGVISDVSARVDRAPWSTCPAAGNALRAHLIGRRLDDVAAQDPALHCTHLHDLAMLGADHANVPADIRFDMHVADRVDQRTIATLRENDRPGLVWHLEGTHIAEPGEGAGRDLRQFSRWRHELAPPIERWAILLRRAVLVSGARRQPELLAARAVERGPSRIGACYTYQLPRAAGATPSANWRKDFSRSTEVPLAGFEVDAADAKTGADA